MLGGGDEKNHCIHVHSVDVPYNTDRANFLLAGPSPEANPVHKLIFQSNSLERLHIVTCDLEDEAGLSKMYLFSFSFFPPSPFFLYIFFFFFLYPG
jgi:hypothetical protein